MEERYIKAISDSPKWIRPAGWLTMPTITSSQNKLAFLFAVYENEENCFTLNYASAICNYTVDWGDSTSINVINSTAIREKRYDYSAISSIILQDDNGVNYKQVIITITLNSGNSANWVIGSTSAVIGAAGNRPGRPQILEAIISHINAVNFSARTAWPLFKNLIIKKLILTSSITSYFSNLINLSNIEGIGNIDSTGVSAGGQFFQKTGPINKLDFTFNAGTSALSFFNSSTFTKMGNITINGNATLNAFFGNCFNLIEVGNITAPIANNISSLFQNSSILRKVGTINTPATTTIASVFNSCNAIEEIIFTDLSNVTVTTSAFISCVSLSRLVLNGLKVSVNVASLNLQRTEIIELLNSLGTAATTQNITLTGNPGMDDITAAEINAILTPKNWTYTP